MRGCLWLPTGGPGAVKVFISGLAFTRFVFSFLCEVPLRILWGWFYEGS